MWELDGPIMFGPSTSKTLINDILSLLSFFDDEFVVNGIYNDADGVIAGNVAGSSKGILGDVKCNHDCADRTVRISGSGAEYHIEERKRGHDGSARSTRGSNHGNTESHDERNDDPKTDGQLVHKADCSSTGCDGDHGTGHVDVCTERYYEVADLLAHAVLFGTFQIDRDGSCGRLGSQSSCVSRDLILIRVKGFFLLTVPAITNWIVMQIRCMMITTRNTFQRMLKMAKDFFRK